MLVTKRINIDFISRVTGKVALGDRRTSVLMSISYKIAYGAHKKTEVVMLRSLLSSWLYF